MARKHWRGVSGFCVKEEAVDGDEKIYYKTFVNPVMMCGAVTLAVKREQENKLDVPEMRMLRLMCIIVKLGRIRNERIRDSENGRNVKYNARNRAEVVRGCNWKSRRACVTAQVGRFGEKTRETEVVWTCTEER